jgi:hypothetical protein
MSMPASDDLVTGVKPQQPIVSRAWCGTPRATKS